MHDRTRELHDTPPRRHGSATLDVEADAATLTICESASADVDTLEGAVLHPDWREQTIDGTRWSAGSVPRDADAAVLLFAELALQARAMPPGPERRMRLRQGIAFGWIAHLLDGAT